ncbi:MAG: TIGR01458 family HAD-type hydrolase [Actinomycetota bacterium]|nr:TIGR01458 family HAD-type hydrolase [Actinomycetota bacterium]
MIASTLEGVEGVLLDLDGVLATSWRPIEGALETVGWLRKQAIPFLVLTNTTTMTRRDLLARLRDAGLELHADQVVTAATATGVYVRAHHPGARCFLITKSDLREDFEGIEVSDRDADVVVIGGAEEQFSYENVNRAFQLLMQGATLLAMHRGLYWKTDAGVMLDAGAYVGALERAAGISATLVGKPAGTFFEAGLEVLGIDAERVVMVGDNVRSDVNGAQNAGLRGVLVRTGVFRQDDLDRAEREPDAVIDSVAALPGLLATGPRGPG